MTESFSEYDALVKILIVGDSNAGKSSLLRTLQGNPWKQGQPTVGVDFVLQTVEVRGKKLKLQIWDTAGQEKYQAIRGAYFRGAHCVAVCFDLTNPISFDNVKHWVAETKLYCDNAAILLIGTKSDLFEKRQVSEDQAQNAVHNFSLHSYVETSAKTARNVEDAFRDLGTLGHDAKMLIDKTASRVDHSAAVSLTSPEAAPVKPLRKRCFARVMNRKKGAKQEAASKKTENRKLFKKVATDNVDCNEKECGDEEPRSYYEVDGEMVQ
eukprot:TRINITY_DN8874_c4_g1_i1.p1 TRINITY_DN8874_c4_g1~~TRINITY_DN8874_c4_g1_i1.p1  ORF type:complete len:285 (+),score=57.41 TRINITY_DN8874_c4_g1_i1:55-855(+)